MVKEIIKKILDFVKEVLAVIIVEIPNLFRRLRNYGVKDIFDAIWDRELRMRSAGLAYYTIIGIVPICILVTWLGDIIQADSKISTAIVSVFPFFESTVGDINIVANSKLDIYRKILPGIMALAIILYSTHCFLNNVQQLFNYIWKSEERKGIDKVIYNIRIAIVLGISVILVSFLFNKVDKLVINLVILAFVLVLSISCAFRFVPYDKKPHFAPAFVSSIITTAILFVINAFLPFFFTSLIELELENINVFWMIFMIFLSWYVVFLGAKLCSILDHMGPFYLHEEIEGLAEVYRLYLTIFVAASIFRRNRNPKKGNASITFFEIGQDMFQFEEDGGDNSSCVLPMPLLDSIINDLMKKGIIEYASGTKEVTYTVKEDAICTSIDSYTVGHLLLQLIFGGNYDLGYQYEKLLIPLETDLSSGLLKAFVKLDTKIVDIHPDKVLSRMDSVKMISEQSKFEEFESYIYEEDREKLYWKLFSEGMTKSEILDGINLQPDSNFPLGKDKEIEIVEKVSFEFGFSPCEEDTEFNNEDQDVELLENVNVVKSIWDKITRLFGKGE